MKENFDHKSNIYQITKDTRVLSITLVKNAFNYAY